MSKEDYTIRLATQDDLTFIISSWTKAMYDLYPHKYALDFTSHYHRYLNNLLNKSLVAVSCWDESPQDIVGYLVYTSFRNELIVHYAYTKLDDRKKGILKDLLAFANPMGAPIIFTHPAKNEKVMQYFVSKYIYDPALLSLI